MHFVVHRAGRDKVLGRVLGLGRGEDKDRGQGKDPVKDEARDKAGHRSTVFNPASSLTTTSRRAPKAVFNHNQIHSCPAQMIRARNFSFICRRKPNIYLIPTIRIIFTIQFKTLMARETGIQTTTPIMIPNLYSQCLSMIR